LDILFRSTEIMVKACMGCGATGFIVQTEDGIFCLGCYNKRSPFIDEVWRIIDHALTNNLEWVDRDAVERRRRTEKFRD